MAYQQSQTRCSVLIASSSGTVRNRWKRAVDGLCVTYLVSDMLGLRRKLLKWKPSVLFIDFNFPRLDGIRGIAEIQNLGSATKILVFTSRPDPYEELLALEAGARGYCSIDIDSHLITRALQVIQKGEIWADRGITTRLVRELVFRRHGESLASGSTQSMKIVSTQSFSKSLTSREQEIVSLVTRAASNKEIADILQITESTVKAHLSSIFRKLKVSDRLALALVVNDKTEAAR